MVVRARPVPRAKTAKTATKPDSGTVVHRDKIETSVTAGSADSGNNGVSIDIMLRRVWRQLTWANSPKGGGAKPPVYGVNLRQRGCRRTAELAGKVGIDFARSETLSQVQLLGFRLLQSVRCVRRGSAICGPGIR